LVVEDTTNPSDIRFLHVLQGADPGVSQDAVTFVQWTSGTAFEGALVHNTVVLFLKNSSDTFAGTTYAVPNGTGVHYITGLTPGAGYTAAYQPLGANLQVTLSAGGNSATADSAGVLTLNPNGGATAYALTVVGGTGSGTYVAGTMVSIAANAPPTGMAFNQWTGAAVVDAKQAMTQLVMPAAATTVTATYAPASVPDAGPKISSQPNVMPNPAVAGQPATFALGAADADGDPLTYSWNFGDGGTGQGSSPTHTFATPGQYLVQASVTDGHVSVPATPLTVTVVPAGNNAALPLVVTEATATLKRGSGKDTLMLSGTAPNVPAPFVPKGATLTLSVQGHALEFKLNASGRGSGSKASLMVSSQPAASGALGEADLHFSAKLSNLDLKSAAATGNGALTVTLEVAGAVYGTTVVPTYVRQK
jgi:hypothetical protein